MLTKLCRPAGSGVTCSCLIVVLCLSGCDDGNDVPGPTGVSAALLSANAETQVVEDDHSAEQNEVVPPKVSPDGPWPRAVVPETTYDFGRMRLDGPDQKRQFQISNEGEAPLELVAGKSTCQCTKFTLDREVVGPGESATLTIEWQAKKLTQQFNHGGTVYTNDPEQTKLSFIVHGSIESSIVTKPQSVWSVGNIVGDEPGSVQATLFSRVIPKLTIEDVSAETEFTSVEYEPMTDVELETNDALCGWKFNVSVRPGFPVGKLDDMLTMSISELEEDVQVAVQANRPSDIRIIATRGTLFSSEKRLLSMGQFQAAKGHKSELTLIVNRGNFNEELKFLEVESDPRSLRASLEPIGKPSEVWSRYRMTIEILPGGMRSQRSRGNEGTVRCRTNHPTEKEIVIKVRFNAF